MEQSRIEKAVELREKGYNCAQAVMCAYADIAGMDEATAYKIAEGFGTGMGGMGHMCGALSAAFILAGLKNSSGIPGDKSTRAGTYKKIKEIAAAFEAKNTSTMCRELRGDGGGPRLRSCPGCVEDAARLVEEILL